MTDFSLEADLVRRSPTLGRMLKRWLDVAGALLLLVAAAPLILLITAFLAVGKGPVIFTQSRVGFGGRRFRCLKFRTMAPCAEAALAVICERPEWALRQKLDADPRVTPIGRFLRRWGLDELPQLINVLRGEMSLVGPRPVIAPETSGYPADCAYTKSAAFNAYTSVRPGLTGLWQVRGGSETPHAARVRLDQDYVAGWTL